MPKHCDQFVKGEDCGFDEGMFRKVTAVLWVLTALPLLVWATPCLRRSWSASRMARASLLLAALSALLCFLDDVLLVSEVHASGNNMTLWSVGTIFLVFAVCVFSVSWCDVAAALGRLHAPQSGADKLIARVRLTYKWMSVVHVPFAVMYSMHNFGFMWKEFNTVVMVWGAWLLFGTVFVLSGLAVVQFYIARFRLGGVDGTRSLQDTALINLVEQVFFCFSIVVYVALYMSDNEFEGANIAAYHSVGFITFWAMHVQVVLFFAILGNTDPLYSQGDLDALLQKAQDGQEAIEVPPNTVGSPSSKESEAA